ncbi:MAG TPA: hypothetical protein VFC02_10305 [Anaerolineales bacterium]|nr:hypothetical protein [Anaerolineales bacterium]
MRISQITRALSRVDPHVDILYNSSTVFWRSNAQIAYCVAEAVAYEHFIDFWFLLINPLADLFNGKRLFTFI